MKTKAVRLYGKKDLRLEEFELPKIKDNEILAKVVCDSICMSTCKAIHQADTHKRVPRDVAQNPVMIGHEFAGEIVEVGAKWQSEFKSGEKFSIQPAVNYKDGPVGILSAPGYSYPFIGGNATDVIIPNEIMQNGCLLPFSGEAYYMASLAEPLSCVIGAMRANYHTKPGSCNHNMDIVDGGAMALLAGAGPMGLALVNYTLLRSCRPRLLVVTDIDQARLDRAASLYTKEFAKKQNVDLHYINISKMTDPIAELRAIPGNGFDDVFVFAPVASVVEQGDGILAIDGCLNFFSGPSTSDFYASINFYNVHYGRTHIVGTSGGTTNDMIEAIDLISKGLDPAGLVTHIGGLDAVIDTTLNLPDIQGGKKLIYTHISMPLTDINSFGEKGKNNPVYAELAAICRNNNGLWSAKAETYLLENAGKL